MTASALSLPGLERGWARWGPPGDESSPWRYELGRRLSADPRTVAFIGLNPSTATAEIDDPTVRRCIGFARRLGFGRFAMLNLFSLRSTDPEGLRRAPDPVGPMNDAVVRGWASRAELVIAAWGAHPMARERGLDVARMLLAASVKLHALGVTKDGHPRHPLYLRADSEPFRWVPAVGGRVEADATIGAWRDWMDAATGGAFDGKTVDEVNAELRGAGSMASEAKSHERKEP